MDCEFCKKTFSSKSNLVAHQKSTKYCLDLQGKENTNFVCEYCLRTFSLHKTLNEHIRICKEKQKKEKETSEKKLEKYQQIEKITEEKNKEIEQLKDKLAEKNQYVAKLEAKLEKMESTIAKIAMNSIRPKEDELINIKNTDKDVPIPLGEKMSIVIEEIKEEDVEYSNITLNNVVISSRPIDHYVNATHLCQAGGKKFNDWFRLDTTKELINELSAVAGIPVSGLVDTKHGGNNKTAQGSWIHPDLSIQLAQWISPKFAIQVSKWIRTLFTEGSLEIDVNLLREKDRDMRAKDHRIKQLESVCLSKQRRVEYPERNVIYMLTTEDHLRRRTYIIGKAKNLTNRLSTYNKTCDHTVVHYRECKNEDDMDTAETMVLNKLKDYREQANRDRFILPEDKDETFFINTIEECIRFM